MIRISLNSHTSGKAPDACPYRETRICCSSHPLGFHPPYWGIQSQFDELFESDALLLGRLTYQGFAAYWPGQQGRNAFADRMNALPKYVASRTLKTADWNANVLDGTVPQAVQGLKQQDGQNMLVYGSGNLVQTLLRHGLVDELRLMVFPLVLGSGKRLFTGGDKVPLNLASTRDLGDGVLLLTYMPATQEKA